jgi:hypothetical protein
MRFTLLQAAAFLVSALLAIDARPASLLRDAVRVERRIQVSECLPLTGAIAPRHHLNDVFYKNKDNANQFLSQSTLFTVNEDTNPNNGLTSVMVHSRMDSDVYFDFTLEDGSLRRYHYRGSCMLLVPARVKAVEAFLLN